MLSHALLTTVLLAAQGPSPTAEVTQSVATEDVQAQAETERVLLPSEIVAARIRQVLRDQRDAEASEPTAVALPAGALPAGASPAGALPEVALGDGGDGEDLDSSGPQVSLSGSVSTSSLGTTMTESVRLAPSWLGAQIDVSPVVAVLLALVFGSVVAWIWRGRTDRESLEEGPRPKYSSVAGPRTPWVAVQSLAMSGRPVHEIARQTEMAQDAILTLLELHNGGAPQPKGPPPTRVGR